MKSPDFFHNEMTPTQMVDYETEGNARENIDENNQSEVPDHGDSEVPSAGPYDSTGGNTGNKAAPITPRTPVA